jgi:hypothetical protein
MPNPQSQVNGHKRAARPHGKSRGSEPPRKRTAVGAAAGALASAGSLHSKTRGALDEQRRQVAGRVHKVRDVLRSASELVRSEHEAVSRYLDQAGQKAEDVAHYIGNVDLSGLRSDVQRFARKNPGWFVGGALVAGLVLGRLFKASTPLALAASNEEEDV